MREKEGDDLLRFYQLQLRCHVMTENDHSWFPEDHS